jgi:hypothetical protein
MCPDEMSKTDPGECGCDVPASDDAACAAVKDGLAHRYSFGGTGTAVTDSVGSKDGTIMNGGTKSSGVLTLDGVSDQYVEMPSGMVSGFTDATLEVWFTWDGTSEWQRIFDFGNTTEAPITGISYLYLCVHRGGGGGPRTAYTINSNGNETGADGANPVAMGTEHHMAVVVDESGGTLSLYLDGTLEQASTYAGSLENITDEIGYLGRSLWEFDDYFQGSLNEFRIYGIALTAEQLEYSWSQGVDPDFLQ